MCNVKSLLFSLLTLLLLSSHAVKFGVKYTLKCLCIHVTREHRFLHPLKSVYVILEVISLLNDAIKSSYDKKGLLLL